MNEGFNIPKNKIKDSKIILFKKCPSVVPWIVKYMDRKLADVYGVAHSVSLPFSLLVYDFFLL
jgi:hypothetical protein